VDTASRAEAPHEAPQARPSAPASLQG